MQQQRSEVQELERRVMQREEALDRRVEQTDNRQRSLDELEQRLHQERDEAQEVRQRALGELERVASLTADEARKIVLGQVEQELSRDIAIRIREAEQRIKEESEKRARNIISLAVQRYAADHVAESTVSVVELPS
ncbi:phosphodiesterase, partial [mine drainage metagenome]